ncbi:hypothetical protein [Metapseudomonas resinovorans]|uniref:hypothetical protein n=1 Tax=Metapseudomonas resinovorans TaxID=53412 RepID=UPI00373AF27B
MQLLGDVHAGATVLDHADDAAQMAFRPLQPFDDIAMTLVLVTAFVLAHRKTPCKEMDRHILSPRGDMETGLLQERIHSR